MENGSGGFLADLTFVGGNFGYVEHLNDLPPLVY
jgi:hypothetical protein